MEAIAEILLGLDDGEKAVVVIEGPPGSGKSVLSAHLWTELVQ